MLPKIKIFVYYYKMAILYHDLNQLNEAKIYYEKSLSYLNNDKQKKSKKNKQKHQRNLYFYYIQLLIQIDLRCCPDEEHG